MRKRLVITAEELQTEEFGRAGADVSTIAAAIQAKQPFTLDLLARREIAGVYMKRATGTTPMQPSGRVRFVRRGELVATVEIEATIK